MASDTSIYPELRALLSILRPKRIEPAQLIYDDNHETIYGEYGFVRKATLDQVRVVAVKTFPPAGGRDDKAHLVLRLARELSIWEPLSHPNILPLTGFHVSDDYALTLVVSPWAAAGNIRGYIEMHSPDIESRISLALDTAAGLKFLHDKKICHAGLKSNNVVVLDKGCAVLCDFGFANSIEDNAKQTGFTTTAARSKLKETMSYASPELMLVSGASPTLPSDVWAWGCLLLEILTGVPPYAACGSTGRASGFITIGKPPADVFELQLPSDLRTLLLRCWNVKMEDRPTMDECFTRLVTAEIGPPIVNQLPSQTPSSYQQVRVLYTSQRLKRLEGDPSSVQDLGQAKDKLLKLENSFGVVWCDSALASVQRSNCQYDSARVLQERVLETFQGINAEWGVASARYELGVIDAKQGKNDVARTQYQEALETFQQLGDPSGVATCQHALGVLDSSQSKYQTAQTQIQAAFDAYQRLEDQSGMASCRLKLGTLNTGRGDYEDAGIQLRQALEIFQRLKDHSGVASCHRELGMLNFVQGRYGDARSHDREALETFQRLADPSGVAWCQRDLGLIDSALEMYEEARFRADDALETFQRIGDPSGIAACLYDIGVIAAEKRHFKFAQRKLLQALDAEVGLGSLSGIAYCQQELGEIAYALYNYEKARILVQEALQIFQSLGDLRGQAGGQRALAVIDFEESKYDDARTRFQKALEIYERLERQPGVEFCQEALRKVYDVKPNDSNKEKKTIDWP